MNDLEAQIRALLNIDNESDSNTKVQRIKQKCQNNKTFQKILSNMTKAEPESGKTEENKQIIKNQRDKNEELLSKLSEKRESINKAKRGLDEKLRTLNELVSTKTRLLDEYTLGLSQTSSDNLMEPMMKLKTFIKKEEELRAIEKKCEEHNREIKEKTSEAHESLRKLEPRGRDKENEDSGESGESGKREKVDDSYAEKMIQEFVEIKRRVVLEDLENREAKKEKINARKAKYEQVCKEFSKALETQEPYLKQKIEDSVRKNVNIEEKRAAVKRMQAIIEDLKKSQNQDNVTKPDKSTKSETKAKEPEKGEGSVKEEDVMNLITKNKEALRHLQASKIRINEFIANNTLATLEEVQKASKGLEANLTITFENWEKIYMLPADVYYRNMPEENYSPILHEMMNLLEKPNKSYFYLSKLIKKIAKKLEYTTIDRVQLGNGDDAEETLKAIQRTYQQKKRKQISELVDVASEFQTELHYKERLENLFDITDNPPGVLCADLLKQYEGWTLSDYIAQWKKLFAPLAD